MRSLTRRPGAVSAPASGIDRMVRNVQTGHFERSLSALTAAGALVTAAGIFFELVTMVGGMGLLAAILRREQ